MRETSNFIQMQISLSTAEDARNYFWGDLPPTRPPETGYVLPPGTYRVIDGMLFRLVPGLPPGIAPSRQISPAR